MAYVDETGYAERFTRRELDQVLASNGDGTLAFARAASDATETVDSYLAAIPGRTFSLPLTVPPARIVGVTADLARYEVTAEILGAVKGPKINIMHYRNKTGYKRRMGHRQPYTEVKITGIESGK